MSRRKPEQIADEIRSLIVSGEFTEGEPLGREPDLVERFGVSRPSLREALRILEAEGLISVVRGMFGGVVVHEPDERHIARTAALVLQARNVPLADVYQARTILEPAAVQQVATSESRAGAAAELRRLITAEKRVIEDPVAFGRANAAFHHGLVALTGNETLTILAQMLDDIVERAVTAVSQAGDQRDSVAFRRRGIRAQERLVGLIAEGAAAEAETFWREHMTVVGKIMLGHRAETVVDLLHHG